MALKNFSSSLTSNSIERLLRASSDIIVKLLSSLGETSEIPWFLELELKIAPLEFVDSRCEKKTNRVAAQINTRKRARYLGGVFKAGYFAEILWLMTDQVSRFQRESDVPRVFVGYLPATRAGKPIQH